MWEKIRTVKARSNEPNFETWARDIRLLVERDGIDPQAVWETFLWAHNDPFWRANILSPGKLRKQFDQLHAKRESRSGVQRHLRTAQTLADWATPT